MEEEVWKDIPKYEGLYQISSFGRVKRLEGYVDRKQHNCSFTIRQPIKETILKVISSTQYGYAMVNLCQKGLCLPSYVHHLVAESFLGPKPIIEGPIQIRHMDGNPMNPNSRNLKYGTPIENSADRYLHGTDARGENNPGAVLTEEKVIEVKKLLKSQTIKSVSDSLNINYSTVRSISQGKRWGWLNEAPLSPTDQLPKNQTKGKTMTEKKTIGLGKKASAVVAPKTVEKTTTTTTKVVQPEPAKKAGIGKKAEEVSVKIEVKNVPAIVGYGDRSKDAPKAKTTAKLPTKASGISSKMEKIKSSMIKAVAHPVKVEEVKEKTEAAVAEVKQEAVNQLDIASTRRPVTAAKKAVVAAGKVSFEEIQKMNASAAPASTAVPFFDPTQYLKK